MYQITGLLDRRKEGIVTARNRGQKQKNGRPDLKERFISASFLISITHFTFSFPIKKTISGRDDLTTVLNLLSYI